MDRSSYRRFRPTLLLLLLFLPQPVFAIPVISCHCFTDRSYDPARPALADPYFLATAQNSLFAELFAVDKKAVVMKKQQGTSADDLWIAYWIAARSGTAVESLLQEKNGKGTWLELVTARHIPLKSFGTVFTAALTAKAPASRLADLAVDDQLQRCRLLRDGELAALRRTGAVNQELILAALLAARTGQPAGQILLEVRNGARSWGSLLQSAAIDPRNMQQEIAAILKQRGK